LHDTATYMFLVILATAAYKVRKLVY